MLLFPVFSTDLNKYAAIYKNDLLLLVFILFVDLFYFLLLLKWTNIPDILNNKWIEMTCERLT